MSETNVVEWDMDEFGVASAVTAEDERWFCLPVPEEVVGERFNAMQDALREVATEFGCARVAN